MYTPLESISLKSLLEQPIMFDANIFMVDDIARDLQVLNDIEIITFDVIVLLAYIYYMCRGDTSKNKALKSSYKRYCEDVIKRHHLPATLVEYVKSSANFIN